MDSFKRAYPSIHSLFSRTILHSFSIAISLTEIRVISIFVFTRFTLTPKNPDLFTRNVWNKQPNKGSRA